MWRSKILAVGEAEVDLVAKFVRSRMKLELVPAQNVNVHPTLLLSSVILLVVHCHTPHCSAVYFDIVAIESALVGKFCRTNEEADQIELERIPCTSSA